MKRGLLILVALHADAYSYVRMKSENGRNVDSARNQSASIVFDTWAHRLEAPTWITSQQFGHVINATWPEDELRSIHRHVPSDNGARLPPPIAHKLFGNGQALAETASCQSKQFLYAVLRGVHAS
jgi:hypothetical protein